MRELGDTLRTKPNLVGCPKCGAPNGFVGSEPRYRFNGRDSNSNVFREWLEWSCTICEYAIKTKVLIPERK